MTDCRDILVELVRRRKLYDELSDRYTELFEQQREMANDRDCALKSLEEQEKVFEKWLKDISDEERGVCRKMEDN